MIRQRPVESHGLYAEIDTSTKWLNNKSRKIIPLLCYVVAECTSINTIYLQAAKAVRRGRTLADIKPATLSTGQQLAVIAGNPTCLECIKAFVDNQTLFNWLKEEFEEGEFGIYMAFYIILYLRLCVLL